MNLYRYSLPLFCFLPHTTSFPTAVFASGFYLRRRTIANTKELAKLFLPEKYRISTGNEKFAIPFSLVHMGPRSNLLSQKNGQKFRDTVPLSEKKQ